jgi:hypothetical protein
MLGCPEIKANGPAIKNSKRCWANGGCDHKFVFGIESWHTTVMNEACCAPTKRSETGAWFLQVQVQVLWGIWVSRYKLQSEQVLSQGTLSFIGSRWAVRLQPNQIAVKVPGAKRKNHDKFIFFIVRVMVSYCFILWLMILSSKICDNHDRLFWVVSSY